VSTDPAFAAVDLGASSGRVMVVSFPAGGITLEETYRFPNRPVELAGTLYWDVPALWSGVLEGLRRAGERWTLSGIAVDSWAIDYALLDEHGALLGNPTHYRDRRTAGVAAQVAPSLDPDDAYAITGIQELAFNTIYQWVAARDTAAMRAATTALLIPDLFTFWLSGSLGSEITNASTTALLDASSRAWSQLLFERLGLRGELFAPLRDPGTACGTLRPEVAAATGLGAVPVFAVGSHDTASAVAGVPAKDGNFAYISSGTWSLVGVEVDAAIRTPEARRAGFSNELGVDGTVRFLKNVMGLWLLQECVRRWERDGGAIDVGELVTEAAAVAAGRSVIDPDRDEFLAPGDMPERIRAECRRSGQPVPTTRGEITRCILDSLAAAYGTTVRKAQELAGVQVEVVHVVGGGSQNALLAQLTADACGLPVVAGPVEAAAYGNALVQARAAGVVTGDLFDLRSILQACETKTYLPAQLG
jgi:rhamnulokinase